MKALSSSGRLWTTGRSIFAFSLAQLVTQAFALVGGLLVVRMLSVEDYAVYALFGALISAAAVTSNLGLSSATTTLLSRAKEPEDFAAIHAGATSLQYFLGIISSVIFVVIFLSNASVLRNMESGEILIVVTAMALVVLLQASATLARAVLASERQLSVINRADPIAGFLRITILGASYLLMVESPLSVPVLAWLLSAGLIALWLNRKIPRIRLWQPSCPPTGLLPMMMPLLPSHLYYIASGLIPVLALGSRAAPELLAAYWALGRLGMVLFSMVPVLNYIAHPFVSRGHDGDFLRRSLLVISAVGLAAILVTISGYNFAETWLLLLGPQYSDLVPYVWIALAVAGLRFLVDTFYLMIVASGETKRQYLTVVAGVSIQLSVVWLTPMRALDDIYLFVSAPLAVELLIYIALYSHNARFLRRRATANG